MKKHASEFSRLVEVDTIPDLRSLQSEDITWTSEGFAMVSVDLRSGPVTILRRLREGGFDDSRPTLFLSECVLIYLDRQSSDSVIKLVSSLGTCAPMFMAIYEQVNPHDQFGKMMMENLTNRGCPLQSIVSSPDDMSSRLRRLGFSFCRTELMSHFTIKVKRPEIIDEVEELNLLQDHYVLAVGATNSRDFIDSVFLS
jgi:hypothetical protein